LHKLKNLYDIKFDHIIIIDSFFMMLDTFYDVPDYFIGDKKKGGIIRDQDIQTSCPYIDLFEVFHGSPRFVLFSSCPYHKLDEHYYHYARFLTTLSASNFTAESRKEIFKTQVFIRLARDIKPDISNKVEYKSYDVPSTSLQDRMLKNLSSILEKKLISRASSGVVKTRKRTDENIANIVTFIGEIPFAEPASLRTSREIVVVCVFSH